MSERTILIVEDEMIIAMALQDHLETMGFNVLDIIASGEQVLAFLEENSPDVILMDILLRGKLTGIDVGHCIGTNFDIPIIYLTAHSDDHSLEQIKKTNAYGYLTKPLDEKQLYITLELALHKSRLERDFRNKQLEVEQQLEKRSEQLIVRNEQLKNEVKRREFIESKLFKNNFKDDLTGLFNRNSFIDHVQRAIDHGQRDENYGFYIIMLDLNRFKLVVDSLGHSWGDQTLIETAKRLKKCVRPGDTVARIGGDEFAILLDDVPSHSHFMVDMVKNIQAAIKKPIILDNKPTIFTASIGAVSSEFSYTQAHDAIRDADTAMHVSQEQGPDQIRYFEKSMRQKALRRFNLETDLRRALENEAFELYYQPVIALDNEQVVGVEALIRWHHNNCIISPMEFIPLAEETGLIVPMGEWVLEEVARQINDWRTLYDYHINVAVNLSIKQLQSSVLPYNIAQILNRYQLTTSLLSLEVTESTTALYEDCVISTLNDLNSMGIQLSIDDFGTGYSSFSRLKHLPFTKLKIDKSFIRDITSMGDDQAIVRAITAMAGPLGLKVIAEGVETMEQLAELRLKKCDEVQGYLFSRPLPSHEFMTWYRSYAAETNLL